eukprot:maker-scaffold96_size378025-snap-gene-2.35 protein:Tk04974 transcript:maker-scaffold96_size378025-snap-gene-2.35-mRNA-1 annotation:"hypothetical protein DAPPUDRAFT_300353"
MKERPSVEISLRVSQTLPFDKLKDPYELVVSFPDFEALFKSKQGLSRIARIRRAMAETPEEEQPAKKARLEIPAPVLEEDDMDESEHCTICMEPWTNSGQHRIASLKCGHFFGLACIEKWLRGGPGNGCPNCNEKAQKKDIRVHFTLRLKAIDTSERDRAIQELEQTRGSLRQTQLDHKTLQVKCQLQAEEIDKLKKVMEYHQMDPTSLSLEGASGPGSVSGLGQVGSRHLRYLKRLDIIRSSSDGSDTHQRDKYCRLMAFNEVHAMLVVTQPSFTALAPGFGVRRINMLERKPGAFLALHKDSIRDLAFHPTRHDQLLSVSQDKSIRLTNINSGQEIQRYSCDSEVWSCAWNMDNPHQFFVGTKRSEIYLFDTRDTTLVPKSRLEFPTVERRPIIALNYVQQNGSNDFPLGGLLVMTLGSLWFFSLHSDEYKPHKLLPSEPFAAMRFCPDLRLILVSSRPNPHSRHIVGSLSKTELSSSEPDFQCSLNEVYNQKRGGSYTERSFLRSCLFRDDHKAILAYGRGSSGSDHKLILEEIGSEKILQEIQVPRPILDVNKFSVNGEQFVAVLTECQIYLYQWADKLAAEGTSSIS